MIRTLDLFSRNVGFTKLFIIAVASHGESIVDIGDTQRCKESEMSGK
jgi:hypothetical protein